jgi:hypothetical protein
VKVRAILVGDDGLFIVYADGRVARLVAGGHAHPSGWSDQPTATRRRTSW